MYFPQKFLFVTYEKEGVNFEKSLRFTSDLFQDSGM